MSGAGKSTVCGAFRESGFAVIDCDVIARETAARRSFLAEIAERFSADMLNADGSLNRAGVAKLIYNDEESRAKYQRIIFPYIIYSVIREICKSGGAVLLDAPTLFESRLDMICAKIVSVCAEERLCEQRIILRDKISPEQARERISAQHNAEFFKAHSDFCIENNGNVRELSERTARVIDILKGRQ